MRHEKITLIRYPGGKKRLLDYIVPFLPPRDLIEGYFVEPFVGSAAVFFAVNPKKAKLSDINKELIDLYRGIKQCYSEVWDVYSSFPSTKKAYYRIRDTMANTNDLIFRAARILYLNRTCFKGMWRHNQKGEFNVGYGGEDRRWVISKDDLEEVSIRLKAASLECCDFERAINQCTEGDFIFIDPPYQPGERELIHAHYLYGKFSYSDHLKLANTLRRASERSVRWAMTISSHPDLLNLYKKYIITLLPIGTGKSPGILTSDSKEVLICNYEKVIT